MYVRSVLKPVLSFFWFGFGSVPVQTLLEGCQAGVGGGVSLGQVSIQLCEPCVSSDIKG